MKKNCWNCAYDGQGPENCGNPDVSYEWSHQQVLVQPEGMDRTYPSKDADNCPGFKPRTHRRTTMYETFEDWFRVVNKLLENAIGLTAEDLPDRCWRDHYDDGTTPRDALDYEYDGNWQNPEAMFEYL